jgi:hypothetical protein
VGVLTPATAANLRGPPAANPCLSPLSPPSTTRATVNASIGTYTQDPPNKILEGVLAEEREWQDQVDWFAKRYPVWDVSTLDLNELIQLCHELGPGPTLLRDHNPYPNIRITQPY